MTDANIDIPETSDDQNLLSSIPSIAQVQTNLNNQIVANESILIDGDDSLLAAKQTHILLKYKQKHKTETINQQQQQRNSIAVNIPQKVCYDQQLIDGGTNRQENRQIQADLEILKQIVINQRNVADQQTSINRKDRQQVQTQHLIDEKQDNKQKIQTQIKPQLQKRQQTRNNFQLQIQQQTITLPNSKNSRTNYNINIIKQQQEDISNSLDQKLRSQIPDQHHKQYVSVLNTLDALSNKLQSAQKDNHRLIYNELQQLVFKYIQPHFHPQPKNKLGEILIKNGKFIINFIELIHYKFDKTNNFLKQYLYEHFKSEMIIQNDLQAFQNQIKNQYKHTKNKHRTPTSVRKFHHMQFQPFVNNSVVADRDQNSSIHLSDFVDNIVNSTLKQQQYNDSDAGIGDNNKQKIGKQKQQQQISEIDNQVSFMDNNQHNIKKQANFLKRDIEIQVSQNQLEEQKQIKNRNRNKSRNKKKMGSYKKSKARPNKQINQHGKISKSSNKPSSVKRQLDSLHPLSKKKKKQDSVLISDSQLSEDNNKKLGSCYHFRLEVDKKDHKKRLSQVRASARLSKKKNQRNTYSKNSKSTKNKSTRKSKSKRQQQSVIQLSSDVKMYSNQADELYIPPSQQNIVTPQSDDDNDSIQQVVQVDWVKKHFGEIVVDHALLYKDFKAMTKQDKQIAKFLSSLQQESQQQQSNLSHSISNGRNIKEIIANQLQMNNSQQNNQGEENSVSRSNRRYTIEELPLTVEEVLDPNINSHNIYAVLKLSKLSGIELGTRYALTRLTRNEMVNRRHVLQDIEKAKQIVGDKSAGNIGYIQLNQQILMMISQKNKEIEIHK